MPNFNDIRVNPKDGSLTVPSLATAADTSADAGVVVSISATDVSQVINLSANSGSAAASITSVTGVSLGTGTSVFANSNALPNAILQFRSLVAGAGTRIDHDAGTITIGLSSTYKDTIVAGSRDFTVSGNFNVNSTVYRVALNPTGVVAGTFVAPTLTVDGNGRITSATTNQLGEKNGGFNAGLGAAIFKGKVGTDLGFRTVKVSGGLTIQQTETDLVFGTSGVGTVSSVALQGVNGIVVSGGPVTTVGTMTVTLGDTGIVAGDYTAPNITVNAQGRITSIASTEVGDEISAANIGDGDGHVFAQKVGPTLQLRALKAGPGMAISETGSLITIAPARIGGAGTYTNATVTIDDYGRVTAALNGTAVGGTGILNSVIVTGNADVSASTTNSPGSTAVALALKPTSVVAGTYGGPRSIPTISVDANGRLTGVVATDIPLATTTTPGLVQLNSTTTSSLVNQAATPFAVRVAYDLANSKLGRLENAVSASALLTPRTVNLRGDVVGTATFDGSADITIQANLITTGVTEGLYVNPSISIDAKGRIVGIASGSGQGGSGSGSVSSVTVKGTPAVLVSGSPITTQGTYTIDLTDSGVVAGSYQNPIVTIDAKGRITSAVSGQPVQSGGGSTGASSSAYSFRIVYAMDGTISVTDKPAGWTFGVQGSQITITHALGLSILPSSVFSYGFSSSAFLNGFNQRIPNGTSSSMYSFVSTNNQFILYSATPVNTSSSNGNYAIVKIVI